MIKKILVLITALSLNNNIQSIEFKKFWNKKETKTLSSHITQQIATFTIKNNNGNINIYKSNKKNIEIKAFIKGTTEQLQNVSLEQKYDEKTRNITVYTKNNDQLKIVDYEIDIPHNSSASEIKIDCENGDISITDFNKTININANKSNVTVENSKQIVAVTLKTGSVKLTAKELTVPNNIFINIENYGIVDLSLANNISSSLKLQTRNGKISSTTPVVLYPPVYLQELNSKTWNDLKKDLKLVIGDSDDEAKLAPIIVQIGSGNILIQQH